MSLDIFNSALLAGEVVLAVGVGVLEYRLQILRDVIKRQSARINYLRKWKSDDKALMEENQWRVADPWILKSVNSEIDYLLSIGEETTIS